jgi:hypothetical protein
MNSRTDVDAVVKRNIFASVWIRTPVIGRIVTVLTFVAQLA